VEWIKKLNRIHKEYKKGEHIEGDIYVTDNILFSAQTSFGVVLECRDRKKKINVRITQFGVMEQYSTDAVGERPYELKVISGREKYNFIWGWNKVVGDTSRHFDFLRRADFYHILTALNDSVLDAIYKSDILEKHYTDKTADADVSKPPQSPSPEPKAP
jgi:hypothetical protein